MKKIILGCAALASTLVLASTVQSSNVFGVLKVDNTDEQVIVCVPWGTVGTGEAISPANLVCTTGLQSGDTLLWYDSSEEKYYGWKFNGTTWASDKIVEDDTSYTAGTAQTVNRGTDALILTRTAPRSPFYLNGQYVGAAVSVTMAQGAAREPKMTFFAPPTAALVDLNEFTYTENNKPATGDKIRFGLGKEFYYEENDDSSKSGWYYNKPTEMQITFGGVTETEIVYKKTKEAKLNPGVAAIYISEGGNPTFTWQ